MSEDQQLKEAMFYENYKNLVFPDLALTSVLASLNVYAIDQSICNSGANVVLHNNGSVKVCQLKSDYNANNIRCKNDGPISFYIFFLAINCEFLVL